MQHQKSDSELNEGQALPTTNTVVNESSRLCPLEQAESCFGISHFELFQLAIAGEISLCVQVSDGLTVYSVDPNVLQTQTLHYALPTWKPLSSIPFESICEVPLRTKKPIQFVAVSAVVCSEIRNCHQTLIPQSFFSHGYSTQASNIFDFLTSFEKCYPESAEQNHAAKSTDHLCFALYPSDMQPLRPSHIGYPAPIVISIGYQHLFVAEAECLRAKEFLALRAAGRLPNAMPKLKARLEAPQARQIEKPEVESRVEASPDAKLAASIELPPSEPKTSAQRKFLRIRELMSRLGVSRPTIYTRLDPKSKYYDETFPKKFKVNGVVVWDEREVDEWMEVQRKKGKDGQ